MDEQEMHSMHDILTHGNGTYKVLIAIAKTASTLAS
jgi:hypothetical protein